MPNEKRTISFKGRTCQLDKKIGGGLEGSVYTFQAEVQNRRTGQKMLKTFAAKIINTEGKSEKEIKKIHAHFEWLHNFAQQHKEVKRNLAYPIELLDSDLGYVMNFADNHVSLKDFINPPDDFDAWFTSDYGLKRRYQIITNLFSALRDIHLAGLVFTDLSPNNIMVHKTENQLVFIDTDNMRRRTDAYSGVLGTPGYMAPEVLRPYSFGDDALKGLKEEDLPACGKISPDSDIFSAAVIAFQLLTLCHPFVGDDLIEGTPEDEERGLNIETDFIFKEGTDNTRSFPLTDKYDDITTPEIRRLFYQTFVIGKDNPSQRPTDEEFQEAFQKALDLIVKCDQCGYERIYHPGMENHCINCTHPFESKVLMVNYMVFGKMTAADAIDSIGHYPQYDVSMDELKDIDGKLPENHLEAWRIVLEPGEKNAKSIYRQHFEFTGNRGERIFVLSLSENGTQMKINVVDKAACPDAYLVEKKTRRTKPLGDGQIFPWEDYGIVFLTQRQGKGYVQYFSKFVRI